jgi:uncharacterized protein
VAAERVRRIICAADPRGAGRALGHLIDAAGRHRAQAIALVGDLRGRSRSADYRGLFRVLGEAGHPAYWVPGPEDAPVSDYLQEAQNIEVVFPFLHGVHGTAAFTHDNVLFAGFGGDVSDDPKMPRQELERLTYPRWEAEYRLKLLREIKFRALVLLFYSAPAHKGRRHRGSEALAELVGTHRPRLVVCGGDPSARMLGTSLVVAPGSLEQGHYAVADLQAQEAELGQLEAAR